MSLQTRHIRLIQWLWELERGTWGHAIGLGEWKEKVTFLPHTATGCNFTAA